MHLNDIFDSERDGSFWRDPAGNLIEIYMHSDICHDFPNLGEECDAIEAALKAGFIRIHARCTDFKIYVACTKDTAEKEKDFIQLMKKVIKMHGFKMVFEIHTGTSLTCEIIGSTPLRSE